KIHPFDKICLKHKIQHRTIKFKHPWTNGMVERFNRKVNDGVLKKYKLQICQRFICQRLRLSRSSPPLADRSNYLG
ncbi:transposase, partial [Candidatus Amesbacteria bacterium]|nr:transposase [Candidatus Amesbacteria bacterium]